MKVPWFTDPAAEFAKLPEKMRARIKRLEPHERACWLWMGPCSYQGCPDRESEDAYGRVTFKGPGQVKATNWLAHRATYTIIVGPIPPDPSSNRGMVLDHLFERCTVRRCVRPDHLEAITYTENTNRGFRWRNGKPKLEALNVWYDSEHEEDW